MKTRKRGIGYRGAAGLLGVALSVCFSPWVTAQDVETVIHPTKIESIAVMPLLKGRYGIQYGESLHTAVSTFSVNPEKLSEGASKIVTRIVRGAIQKRYGDKMIPAAIVTEAFDAIPRDKDVSLRDLAQRVGKAVNASHIIAGNVWRYKDKVGGGVGAPSPAAVAFGTYLIEVDTGRVLWQAFFDKTQKALSENLLEASDFFKAGGRWLSAEELARIGVNGIFKKYPY